MIYSYTADVDPSKSPNGREKLPCHKIQLSANHVSIPSQTNVDSWQLILLPILNIKKKSSEPIFSSLFRIPLSHPLISLFNHSSPSSSPTRPCIHSSFSLQSLSPHNQFVFQFKILQSIFTHVIPLLSLSLSLIPLAVR